MRLLLVTAYHTDIFYPIALLCLNTYLKSRHPDIEILNIDGWTDGSFNKAREFKPDAVGISAMTPDYERATRIAQSLRIISNDLTIIIGGVHITIEPDSLRKCFDIGVIGEGEEAICEIVDLLKNKTLSNTTLNSISGIVYWDEDKKIKTRSRPPLDLSTYPQIDYSIVDQNRMKISAIGTWGRFGIEGIIESSRGCPFKCVFCATRKVWNGEKIRYFPVDWVVNNVLSLISYGCSYIHLTDDLFAANKKRLGEMQIEFTKYKIQKRVQFAVTARTSFFDERLCDLLKSVGVTSVFFGFESGNDRILKYLKGEQCDIQDNYKAVEICKKKKMECWGAIMIGAPTETIEEMMDTVRFVEWCEKKGKVRRICIGTLVPYPGTKLWDIVKDSKIMKGGDDYSYFETVINSVTTPLLVDKKLHEEYRKVRLLLIKAAHGFKWNKFRSLFFHNPFRTIKYGIFEAPWWLIKRLFDSTMP